VVLDEVALARDPDRDRAVRAAPDARGLLADRGPIGAHVALAHDAEAGVEPRHFVRAGEGAVAAADAAVVEVADDAGERVLGVGGRRAALHARWLEAVMAAGGDRL